MVVSKLYGIFSLFAVCTTTSSCYVVVARSSRRLSWTHVMGFDALKALFDASLILMVRRKKEKKIAVFHKSDRPCFKHPTLLFFFFFFSVKMQNKKVKHLSSIKYPYFHKIAGPTLFFAGEKNGKKNVSPTYLPIFFSMLVEAQLFSYA